MKPIWNDTMPAELRDFLAKLKIKEDRRELFYKLAIFAGILVVVCLAAAAVWHLLKNREDDEDDWDMDCDECDENGCYYTDEEDFEVE